MATPADFMRRIEMTLRTGPSIPVELHATFLTPAEKKAVIECLDDGRVSTAGVYTRQLEERLQDYTGAKFAIATNCGTAALHLALLAHDVGAGDEVLMPSYSYIAPANAVSFTGAIPHFVECEEVTQGIDATRLEVYLKAATKKSGKKLVNRKTGKRIAALMPVHSHGMPSNMESLAKIAKHYGLALVEDAAEAIGSTYHKRHAGTFGTGALSFNGNKIVTTGGGGAVLTNDAKLAQKIRALTHVQKLPHPYEYRYGGIGYNYGMPSLNAALGIAQMQRIESLLASKRTLADYYRRLFDGFGTLLADSTHSATNHWQSVLVLDKQDKASRNAMIEAAHKRGFLCRAGWTPLHTLPFFSKCPRDGSLAFSRELAQRSIILPSNPSLAQRVAHAQNM